MLRPLTQDREISCALSAKLPVPFSLLSWLTNALPIPVNYMHANIAARYDTNSLLSSMLNLTDVGTTGYQLAARCFRMPIQLLVMCEPLAGIHSPRSPEGSYEGTASAHLLVRLSHHVFVCLQYLNATPALQCNWVLAVCQQPLSSTNHQICVYYVMSACTLICLDVHL